MLNYHELARRMDGQGLVALTYAEYTEAAPEDVFQYRGGAAGAKFLAYLIGQELLDGDSELPPPSPQSRAVIGMCADRDGWKCHLCGDQIDPDGARHAWRASPDHLTPRFAGGTDSPSNIRISHLSCNKSRGKRDLAQYRLTCNSRSDA